MNLEKIYNKHVFTALLIVTIIITTATFIAIVVVLRIPSFEVKILSIFIVTVIILTILFMMYAVFVKLKWFSNYFSKISFQKEKNEKKLKLSALYKPIFPLLEQLESKNKELEDSVIELRRQSVVFEHNDLLLQLNAELIVQKEELTTLAENLSKANKEISKQKQIAEDQNRNLTDNLAYASIIQAAVLTPTFNPRSFVKDYFILYKPQGIVSGDYYWFKQVGDHFIFALADCTGHGLSGALMSMMGISFLTEITSQLSVQEYDAGLILNSLRRFIVESLNQTGKSNEVHDGMDIALGIYRKNKKQLEIASAYNIVYYIPKDADDDSQIVEYKGQRMPAGISDKTDSFTSSFIDINIGDRIYISTDGYYDQLGGQLKIKKFNRRNFRRELFNIRKQQLSEQKMSLLHTFEDFKGEHEQVDDVTVLGIEF